MGVKTKVYIPATVCCFDTHFHFTLGYRRAVRSSWHILCIRTPTPIVHPNNRPDEQTCRALQIIPRI